MSKFGKVGVISAFIAMNMLTIGAFAEEELYVLREYGGEIALFREGSEQPIAVYRTPVSSLYPADAELLKEGIRVKTAEEIARLTEDLNLE